jgi:TRAP-type C4-dicarboxylate transport system permease small subunit
MTIPYAAFVVGFGLMAVAGVAQAFARRSSRTSTAGLSTGR